MDIKSLMRKPGMLLCINIRWAVPELRALRETWLGIPKHPSDEIFWGTLQSFKQQIIKDNDVCLLLLASSQKLSVWSPRVGKGSMWPKRITLEKVRPNHEFPMILMQTHRMGSWQQRGVTT